MTTIAPPVHLMTGSIDILRETTAADSSGFPKPTFGNHLTGLPARIQPMSGAESLRYGRESNRNMWRIYTVPGKDITEKDRVQFIDKTTGSSVTRTLDIQEVKNAQLAGAVLRLICEETK